MLESASRGGGVSASWSGGVCSGGIWSGGDVCFLVRGGGSGRGGMGGGLVWGVSAPRGGGIPTCTEVDPLPPCEQNE